MFSPEGLMGSVSAAGPASEVFFFCLSWNFSVLAGLCCLSEMKEITFFNVVLAKNKMQAIPRRFVW